MMSNDQVERERRIEDAIRRRHEGLDTPGVTFASRIADDWELAFAERDATKKPKRVAV